MRSPSPGDPGSDDLAPIRIGVARDLPSIERIVGESFENPWSSHLLLSAIRNHHYDVRVIRRDDRGVAAFYIAHSVLSNSNLDMVAVAQDDRGMGHGKRLVNYWIGAARERHLAGLTLQVNAANERAQALYKSLQFRTVRVIPGYYPNGDSAYEMRLRLATPSTSRV